MKIEEIEIDKLIPYEFNNKLHDETQVNRIANSIKEFGFLQPIVIDKNNIVVVGHGRVEGAKKLGLKTVPCLMAENLTDGQIKKYRILDNKLNESEWDVENLKLELEELPDLDFGDLHLDVSDLFPDLEVAEEEKETVEDEAPEVSQEAKIVEYGDIFQLGKHRLMCGDATKFEDLELLMDNKLADIILTDPPYGMKLNTDYSKLPSHLKNGNRNYSKIIGDNEDFTPNLITTIFDNFAYCNEIFIFGADYFAELLQKKNSGSWLVWDKRVDERFDKMIGSAFELCWSKNKHKREIIRCNNTLYSGEQDAQNKVHPTQKPIKVMAWILNKYSKEDNSVVDLFGGSGSTLIACEQLNRKCYTMEIDPIYVEVIIKRFHNLNPDAEIKCLNRDADLSCILKDA